jgi:hypothetical protein
MKWPAATSDYMAWVTSSLNIELENNAGKFIEGGTLVGDCAYVKKLFMATPLKGMQGGHEEPTIFTYHNSGLPLSKRLGSWCIGGQFYVLPFCVQCQK